MPLHFNEDARHTLHLYRTVKASEEERNVIIPLDKMCRGKKNAFLCIAQLNVTNSDNLPLAWAATHSNGKSLVPGDRVTNYPAGGFEAKKYLPPVLYKNVLTYAYSTLRRLIKPDMIKSAGKGGRDYEIKTYHMNNFREGTGVPCLLLSQMSTPFEHPLVAAVLYILANDSLCDILKYFCQSSYHLLEQYKVAELGSQQFFPMTTSCRLKSASSVESVWVLPLDALEKMFEFCNELERHSHYLYVEKDNMPAPFVSVLVPPGVQTSLAVEVVYIRSLGFYKEAWDPTLKNRPDVDFSKFADLDPASMAREQRILLPDCDEHLSENILELTTTEEE